GRVALGAGLGDEVLLGAGQAREPVQYRQAGAGLCLRRQVHAHGHVAAQDFGTVAMDVLPAAETGAVFESFGVAHGLAPSTGSSVVALLTSSGRLPCRPAFSNECRYGGHSSSPSVRRPR